MKAIQEQQQIIEYEKQKNARLEAEITDLKSSQKALESRLNALESKILQK